MHLTFCNVNDAFTWMVSGIQEGLNRPEDARRGMEENYSGDGLRPIPPPHTIPTVSVPSRYGPCYLIPEPVTLTYLYPCQRVLWNADRDCNPFFHLIECLWMLAGRNDVAPLVYFNKKMAEFSDDGKTMWGAYGHRWRQSTIPAHHTFPDGSLSLRPVTYQQMDQIQMAIDILRVDRSSRRVVLQMWLPSDLERVKHSPTCKDVPCNTEIILLVRNGLLAPSPLTPSQALPTVDLSKGTSLEQSLIGRSKCPACDGSGVSCSVCGGTGEVKALKSPPKKPRAGRLGSQSPDLHQDNQFLDITVINRSNDLVWGCLGANYVHMSFLQEYIACALGLKVGLYHQFTNNLHAYETNWFPDKWLSNPQPDPYMSRPDPYPNPPLFPSRISEQQAFDEDCQSLFSNSSYGWDAQQSFKLIEHAHFRTSFFQDVIHPLILAWNMHLARRYLDAIILCERITHADWRLACKQWLQRRQLKYENKPRQVAQPSGQHHEISDSTHSEIPPIDNR